MRRGHSELQAGIERVEKLWDSMVDKHLGELLFLEKTIMIICNIFLEVFQLGLAQQ